MLKNLYSIYDVKVGAYGTVMVMSTDGEAIRVVQDEANRKDSMMCRHAEDFRLDYLGCINLVTGEIDTVNAPRHIVDCAQLKRLEDRELSSVK